jgi:Rrf2 family transcriptional regulator, repressor of oqxAB
VSSGRFAMAVHALALLSQDEKGMSSDFMAGSINTHAVFLRRVLRLLARAGLIVAQEGRRGGYRLCRPAASISLAEVYRVIEPEGPIAPSPCEPSALCPVGSGMRAAFAAAAASARAGMEAALARQTVADVARTARHRGRARRAAPRPPRAARG